MIEVSVKLLRIHVIWKKFEKIFSNIFYFTRRKQFNFLQNGGPTFEKEFTQLLVTQFPIIAFKSQLFLTVTYKGKEAYRNRNYTYVVPVLGKVWCILHISSSRTCHTPFGTWWWWRQRSQCTHPMHKRSEREIPSVGKATHQAELGILTPSLQMSIKERLFKDLL